MAAVEDKDMDKIIGLNTKLYGSNKFILPAEVKAPEELEQTQEFERVKLPIVSESFFETHGSGGGGTSNYNLLTNKPKINGVTLEGNKTDAHLQLQKMMEAITEQSIDKILYGG